MKHPFLETQDRQYPSFCSITTSFFLSSLSSCRCHLLPAARHGMGLVSPLVHWEPSGRAVPLVSDLIRAAVCCLWSRNWVSPLLCVSGPWGAGDFSDGDLNRLLAAGTMWSWAISTSGLGSCRVPGKSQVTQVTGWGPAVWMCFRMLPGRALGRGVLRAIAAEMRT